MTADKSRAMSQLNDIKECCICFKTFTDPRTLPCIHTFCFLCLKDMAEKSNKKPGDQLQCPVCRKGFAIPGDGVKGTQKDVFMANFLEVRSAVNQSKIALLCDICKSSNDDTEEKIPEAIMQCLDCEENQCEDCCRVHKSSKLSKNHKILKLGSEAGKEEAVKSLPGMTCDYHHEKVLDYYCADCKKVVCVSCFDESHKAHDCKDVNIVEDEFRKSIQSNAQIISTLARELMAKRRKMESKDDYLKKIAIRERDILKRSKELKDIIDEHSKSLLSSLEGIKSRHLKEVEMEEEEVDRRFTILESFSRYCDELRAKGSASEVCRSKDELQKRADELEEDHETYIMRPRVSFDVQFQAADNPYNFLKTMNGNIIGSVNEKVEQLEDFAVVIGDDIIAYKINLRRLSETVSSIQVPPSILTYVAAAAVCNNVMFITGVGETFNEIWKYVFAAGWKRCGSLLRGREMHCAQFLNEKLYICGGSANDFVLDSIEAYNPLTEKSTTVGNLRVGFRYASSVAYKGSIYVFGGMANNRKPLDCVQVFSPVDRTCTLLSTSLPRPCYFLPALLWETYAILLNSDECFILNLDENTWHERHRLKIDTHSFGTVIENGRIFVIGGENVNADEQSNDVKYERVSSIVNNEEIKWKTHCRLPEPISFVSAVAKLSLTKQ